MFEHPLDQANTIRDTKLKDQFGRMWHCSIDKKTGQPTGCPNPIDWVDPLNTPNSYLTVPYWEDGTARTDELMVDFEGWIADVESNNSDWYAAIGVMGEKKFPLASSEERDDWPTNPHLTKEAGPKPYPTVEMLKKAMNGDKHLLGLGPKPKKEITDLSKLTYQEFVHQHSGMGLKIPAIAEKWQVHLANLRGEEVAELVIDPVTEEVEV